MRQSLVQFNTSNNSALVAALHTAGDIRAGASLQSGDRNGPLHDRVGGLRRMHFLHDISKNISHKCKYPSRFLFEEILQTFQLVLLNM